VLGLLAADVDLQKNILYDAFLLADFIDLTCQPQGINTLNEIDFANKYYRVDIGQKALKALR
jgi:hypothetical protein